MRKQVGQEKYKHLLEQSTAESEYEFLDDQITVWFRLDFVSDSNNSTKAHKNIKNHQEPHDEAICAINSGLRVCGDVYGHL